MELEKIRKKKLKKNKIEKAKQKFSLNKKKNIKA